MKSTRKQEGYDMRYLIIAIFVLFVTTGCANTFQSGGWQPPTVGANYGPYPENYVTIVKHWYGQHLKDPDSAKFVEITTPQEDAIVLDPVKKKAAYGYSVCARVKAKTNSGRFSANQKLLIREGKVIQYISPKPIRGREYVDPCPTQD